ncbi:MULTISPECIES: hypothetical protein [Thioclava]|uniref:D-galactarate dehydratase n=1 Tax=Thioclava litoralis TaxID=3076557 RepID=A0ABZ1E1M3_9RHOB|nr:hypothetical protein RPE78_00740 [Thioclava sp. FTW29]
MMARQRTQERVWGQTVRLKQGLVVLVCGLGLSACSQLGGHTDPAAAPGTGLIKSPIPQGAAHTAQSLDQASAGERAAAMATSTGGTKLGTTVASLGDPTQAGFWLKTSLVKTQTKGRVTLSNGKSVQVMLLPAEDGASQLSLSALRMLDVSLTDLPTLTVYAL